MLCALFSSINAEKFEKDMQPNFQPKSTKAREYEHLYVQCIFERRTESIVIELEHEHVYDGDTYKNTQTPLIK